ncbi:transmembrane-type terpene cyclase [Saccharothrix variisporea]|uniref:Uncharacterized protein n=1 Tax=Saccharothrix variisporea TaxID=543527 RepID=A0A495XFA5_9PSEU|nr:hypothetical protein [Saccharothrix variisporea]RKT72702.1 hypothetical protein DFJ66_6026 [Saccharothrix variisporea]
MTPPVLDPQAAVPEAVPGIAFAIVGVCTFAIYLLAIRRGFLDKRSTLPVFAACANVSWEFTYAFIYPVYPEMRVILYFWLPLNLVLLWQALRWGRQDFPGMSRAGFAWMVAGWSLFALSFMVLATREFDDRTGAYTTVFVVVLMEALFIQMLRTRGSTVGQTMYIALLKTVIDVSGAVGLIAWYPNRWLLHQMIVAEVVLDVVYAVLLYRRFRADGLNPWRKW